MELAMPDVWDAFVMALMPSMLMVAWLAWRADAMSPDF